jgi:CheY-like chemotaxis protein
LGFSELLEAEVAEPKHREYLQSIRTSAGSLLQIINDILDMSKVEAGVLELRLEPTDPREICDFISTVFKGPAAKKGVKMNCRVAQNMPQTLLLDRGRLRQVLVNLVGNAVRFTDHGHIFVSISWEHEATRNSHITLIIEVEDTGVGIPADKLESIFKPFVQAGGHQEKERMGTGLGLAIVNHLTQLMGGTVTVASVVGQGSAFHVRFPNVAVSPRLPTDFRAETAHAIDFSSLKPSRFLVVDDNEMNCRLIAGMFEGTEHVLDFATNGREAVDRARGMHPDVILLDIRMPNLDGRAALGEIRRIEGLELTPIIAVTASNLRAEELELREAFSGYLRKPFTRRELFNELAQFIPRSATDGSPIATVQSQENRKAPMGKEACRKLIVELRNLEKREWPEIRDSLAVNESRAFATHLEKIGRESGCEPLLDYSHELNRYAESYAVDALENHIQSFPALIERIEQSHES